ncbi:hypothetical protein [Lentibacillus sp. CBA3610]|uniref:hypothetical protein n=1 Tax=Lentibacillus sp. CBA3610 TaxID=2518176 RepID=UPI0015962CB7|nr:hypothetical protein [Lentibacillus sp. CBA3610]QKY70690.1 hypothetical protein Len3610_14785 [Lentibacillus sp. CBA3610]
MGTEDSGELSIHQMVKWMKLDDLTSVKKGSESSALPVMKVLDVQGPAGCCTGSGRHSSVPWLKLPYHLDASGEICRWWHDILRGKIKLEEAQAETWSARSRCFK